MKTIRTKVKAAVVMVATAGVVALQSLAAPPTGSIGSPQARTRIRDLGVRIPASALRGGVNVLAVEVHRAPADEVMFTNLKKSEFYD